MVVNFIVDYYKNVSKYPIQSQVDFGYLVHHGPDSAPYFREPLESILKDVSDSIILGLTHWQSPNFFGHFQAKLALLAFLVTCSTLALIASSHHFQFILMEEDVKAGLIPMFICTTLGTTTTKVVDPIKELGQVTRDFKVWLHIDAAYVSSALELADSINMNLHKWFLTNLDYCCLRIKKPRLLTDSLSLNPEILRNNASKTKYGFSNLMFHIRSNDNLAKQFEAHVGKDHRFKIMAPRKFALVCFKLKPKQEKKGRELKSRPLMVVNKMGGAFMTHVVVGGIYIAHCAVSSTLTKTRW
ncbi:hypothetical protein PVL29_004797 [Vitis rotundifolia]|uniref:Uncharacterized protein n=1 Tax=Vitis rotundifolia TaxID=103349 RepID=A0AA39E1G5_VITRO|nr:hypothetical protein PVL29_004797 [Vitis rotundifolia]